jgi:hypothetical protein
MKLSSSSVRATLTVTSGSALMLLSICAHASLGATAATVSADSAALRGQVHSTPLMQYDVQEIDNSAGTVREYVTRAGQVFAVTWQGVAPPDLAQLLGQYFPQLQTATAQASHGAGAHRRFSVTGADVVLQSVARQRDFHGIAYVPSLVPAGVDTAQLP